MQSTVTNKYLELSEQRTLGEFGSLELIFRIDLWGWNMP